jgi:hypothetical protein
MPLKKRRKKKKSSITLGECIIKLKAIASSISPDRAYRPDAIAIGKFKVILELIDAIEVPELVGESSEEKENNLKA